MSHCFPTRDPDAENEDYVFFTCCGAKRYHVVPFIIWYQFEDCYHTLGNYYKLFVYPHYA